MPILAAKNEKRATRNALYPHLWTAEEFLDWLQPKVYADLIEGRRFMHSPASFRHADLLNIVDGILRPYLDHKKLSRLYREANAVRFGPRDVYLPNLMYFTNEQAGRLLPGYAPFAPTLVVEALSKKTARRETGVKLAAYERCGVQEYWVLDPTEGDHRFYAREGEILAEFGRGEERVEARSVPGFFLRRQWLDPANPPSITECLRKVLAEG